MNQTIARLAQHVRAGKLLDRSQAFLLVEAAGESPWDLLYWANCIRMDHFGRKVRLCSIIPGKLGGCGEDCKWCAQSAGGVVRPMTASRTPVAAILEARRQAAGKGVGAFGIVNSGRRPSPSDLDDVLATVAQVPRRAVEHMDMCVSLGELTADQAKRLAAAGVRRVNHNLETSRAFYPRVVTTHSYDDRLRSLKAIRQAGLRICSGGLFGMGETWEDRVDLALTLRDEVGPEVVPLNFLNPIPGTAMEHRTPMPPMEILTLVALYRLMLPEADLKLAGGREVNLRDLQSWMFYAGATSCMTGNYLTTPGREVAEDLQMIRDLGLEVVRDFGA